MTVDRREFLLTAAAGAGILLGAPGTAGAQAPALIPRRVLFADPYRSVVRISPDSARIAFLGPLGGVLNLWVGPIADPVKARPLTRVTDRNLGPWLVWLDDNRHVLFFREQGGDENWQIHRVDVDTGDIRALTPGPGVKAYVQQTSRHFGGELLVAHNRRDPKFFDIFRVNVATGASELWQSNEGVARYLTDRQFRVRFAVRYEDDGSVQYLRHGPDGEWELFTRIDMVDAMTTYAVGFSDDGTVLYWLDSRGRDTAAVVAEDLATGARRTLAEDARIDFVELTMDPSSGRPIAAAAVHSRKHWQVIDPAYTPDFARLVGALPGDVSVTGLSREGRHWVVHEERAAAAGRFFHYHRAQGTARFLFPARRALEQAPLVPMEAVTVRARDGLALTCYLSRPRPSGTGPRPMVLLVHGGPWARATWGFSPMHQWLANRGYVVLGVNYRGSTGFGKTFVNAANMEWAGKMHDDLIDAVDWAIAEGIAEPARVAIYGGSYGGYAALVGVTFTPEKFACAVDLFGISNLVTLMNTIPAYWKSWQTVWKARMGDYTTEAGRRFLDERSPLTHVDRIVRPLLIGQGANDVRVKPSESEQIVAAMQQRGIPVTYVSYADEGHGFRRAPNRRSFTAVAEAFLAKHLGGRAEPVGDDFADSTIEFKSGRELIPGLG